MGNPRGEGYSKGSMRRDVWKGVLTIGPSTKHVFLCLDLDFAWAQQRSTDDNIQCSDGHAVGGLMHELMEARAAVRRCSGYA